MESPNWTISNLFVIFVLLVGLEATYGQTERAKVFGLSSTAKIPNDFLVTLHASSTEDQDNCIARFLKNVTGFEASASLMHKFSFKDILAVRLKIPENVVAKLRDLPEVKLIEANQKVQINAPVDNGEGACVSQTSGKKLWGLSRIGSRQKPNYITATYTYQVNDGSDVSVYVVDTGIYAQHEEFGGRVELGYTASAYISEGGSDLNGHGSHVSATIGGSTYGVAKNVTLIPVKVLNKDGVGTSGDVLEGLQWVYNDFVKKRKAKGSKAKGVVNMSLGAAESINVLDDVTTSIINDAGLSFVVAAGNMAGDACNESPARVAAAVTVGATTNSDALASFSNTGPCVDILAPGVNILSAFIGSTSASATMSGTSMAAPHVTGVISRYLSQQCNAPSPASVKAWLQDMSTTSAISFSQGSATPNMLVYMSCLAGTFSNIGLIAELAHTDIDPSLIDSRYIIVLVSLWTIGLLAFVSFITTCCAFASLRSLRDVLERRLDQSLRPLPPGYQTLNNQTLNNQTPPPYRPLPLNPDSLANEERQRLLP